jgi:hypothetical protein
MGDWKRHADVAPPPVGSMICQGRGKLFPPGETVQIDSRPYCAECKPAALQRLKEGVASGDAERIRKEHINHEASVKSVGFLYVLGGVLLIAIGSVLLAGGMSARPGPQHLALLGGVYLALGVFQVFMAVGLRRLRPWSRIAASILSAVGLLAFPVGTIINGYILYLLVCANGRTVFSEDYQRVIEQTPHIRYKTSILIWIALILILNCLGAAILAPILSIAR